MARRVLKWIQIETRAVGGFTLANTTIAYNHVSEDVKSVATFQTFKGQP